MESQDSEPLFGDDVYSLLRDDSLLRRVGSTNFSTLIDPNTSVASEMSHNQPLLQQTQENPQPKQEITRESPQVKQEVIRQSPGPASSSPQEMIEVETVKAEAHQQFVVVGCHATSQGKILVLNNQQEVQIGLQQQQPPPPPPEEQQQCQLAWDAIDQQDNDESTPAPLPASHSQLINQNSFMALVEESSSLLPDSTFNVVPSLQPWAGKYNFNISLPTDNKDRNKWCYSEDIKKLYVCPNVAVPVHISMSKWADANITITPVFQQSQYRMDPVTRCYNCKNTMNCDPQLADFVVQVDGEGCIYEVAQDRPIVKVPLQFPAPGEDFSTLLVKLMCLTSCVGGPNRRPFCLVLTLRCNITGTEIGRQILDVKCCKCPSRDMVNDEKATCADVSAARSEEGKLTKIRKLSTKIKTKPKRTKPTMKVEPGTETRYVNIAVPVEFELQVKSYVNGLIGEQILRRHQPNLLLYPDEEDTN